MSNDHLRNAHTFLNEATDGTVWSPEQQPTVATLAVAEATLALAYEQRTANLIAAFTLGKEQPREVFEAAVRDHDSEAAKVIAKWNGIGKQIEERLGFK